MFENFSHKQKLFGLGVIFLLLFLAANKRSFRVTRNAYKQMKEVESRLEYMKNSTHNSLQLQNQIQAYDKVIGRQGIEVNEVQQAILNFVTDYDNVKIEELNETHISKLNGIQVTSNHLILEGSFNTLTNVIYEFEKRFKESSLVSVSFKKKVNYNNRRNKLKVELIFQNYEKDI